MQQEGRIDAGQRPLVDTHQPVDSILHCDFYADQQGGSMARLTANECVLRETAERAGELER